MSGAPPVSRRLLLGTLLVGGLTACDDVPLEQTRPGAFAPQPSAPQGPDPDEDLLRAALVLEATHVARLDRVMALALPAPSARLVRSAWTVHNAHVDLLRGEDLPPRPRIDVPPRRLLGRLPALETELAGQHATACLTAQSGPFARMLASMAAAARQQAVLLAGLGGGA